MRENPNKYKISHSKHIPYMANKLTLPLFCLKLLLLSWFNDVQERQLHGVHWFFWYSKSVFKDDDNNCSFNLKHKIKSNQINKSVEIENFYKTLRNKKALIVWTTILNPSLVWAKVLLIQSIPSFDSLNKIKINKTRDPFRNDSFLEK